MKNSATPQPEIPTGAPSSQGHIPGYPKPEDGGPTAGGNARRSSGPGARNNRNNKRGPQGAGMPEPPKVGRPDGLAPNLKGAPEDVKWGVWAWLSVAGLQILYALVQFMANLMDDRDLRRSVTTTLEEGGGIPDEIKDTVSVDTLVLGTNILTTAWLVAAALICIWLTFRAGRGAVYSRMFLNVGSVYLMLTAGLLALSSGPPTMAVGYVLSLGILSILSGVTAGLGMWFMSRPGNGEWFGIPSDAELEKYAAEYQEAKRENERKNSAKPEQKSKAKQGKK